MKKILVFAMLLPFLASFNAPPPLFHAVTTSITVSGKVTNDGYPLPNVSVLVKGTATGTVTDADGNYVITISDVSEQTKLRFSAIGFLTNDILVDNRITIDVVMTLDPATYRRRQQ